MNWGIRIVIGLSVFIVFITTMVVKMMSTSTDLESVDYYSREVTYENEIISMKNTALLQAAIRIQENESHVIFQLPEKLKLENINIKFIRPNNEKLDREFKVGNTKTFLIPKNQLEKGNYRLEINFNVGSDMCLQKDQIII
jgi:hypothetical protein